MATSHGYEVVLVAEEGGFNVTVPALPGCASQGDTREEAHAMIREAIEVYTESLVAHGDPSPDVQGTRPMSAAEFDRYFGDLRSDGEG